MELDPFTKKLLERTKARRENLDKKEMSSAIQHKRRTPMSEMINFTSCEQEHDPAIQLHKEGSPKRHCKDTDRYKVLSNDKENSSSPIIQNEKENNEDPEINTPQQFQDLQNLKRKSSNNEHDLAVQHYKEDSPKRQCKDVNKYEVLPNDKENSCTTTIQNEKENNAVSKRNIPQQFHDLQTLKRKNSNNGDEFKPIFIKQKTSDRDVGDAAFSSQTRFGCKKRLAALALQINQWEDESSQFPSENFVSKISTNSLKSLPSIDNPLSSTNEINTASLKDEITFSNTFTKDTTDKQHVASTSINFSLPNFNQMKDKSPPRPTLEDDGEISDPVSVTAYIETKTSPKNTVSKHQQQESQGFTKSPSASKLQYEYANKSILPKKQKLESIHEDVVCSSIDTDKTSAPKKIKTVTFQEPEIIEEMVDDKNKEVDPAELPLSARRALFEKAFSNGNAKTFSSDKCEMLSVAEKKAMFEKTSSGGGKLNHPIKHTPALVEHRNKTDGKVQQPEKLSQVTNKQPSIPLAVSNISSPMKTTATIIQHSSQHKVGDHTRQIQQQLFKDDKKWQNNEIITKNKLERKQEMADLLNRWERASSAYSTATSKVLDDIPVKELSDESVADVDPPNKDDIEHSSQGYDNSQIFDDSTTNSSKLSFAILHDDSNASKIDDVASEIEACESNSDVDNESYREESESDGEEDISMQETGNITEQAVAVCDEIDELLDDALQNESSSSDESAITATPVITASDFIEKKETMKPPIIQKTDKLPSNKLPPVTVVEGKAEVPLMHTISVYRRQKQELQLTPIKKIVRREHIQSPPSSDDDEKIAVLQEKLKALHEEVLAQQTVISQASQALNLCHSTTEFTDSTEQVEAERLLLIATQKRQAYLNEIHRLKTDKVLGIEDDGTGTLTLSDICLGVKHEFLRAKSEGKLETSIHYFICLVRCGAQLIATQMLSTEDKITANSLNYTNHITIQELRSNFNVSFEVYALETRKEVIPHSKKYHIKKDCSILRLTPKAKKSDSRLISPAISSPGGPNAVRTPSFGLVGFARLTLHNVNKTSYILEKVPYVSPLEGTLSMKVQLHAKHDIVERGFLNMFEDVSGFGAWHRRWCILQGNYLAYWKYPEDDKKKDPIGAIDLRQCVTSCVKLVSRDICARPHTFQLVTIRKQEKGDKDSLISQCRDTVITTKHLLSADTKEERILWCNRLNDVLSSIRKWDPVAMQPTEHN